MHEVTTNIERHGIGFLLPVMRGLAYVLAQMGYAVVGATTLDARITVGNKGPLKKLVGIAEVEMVHDAVAEHGSEHLALLGIGDDESISTVAPRIALSADHHTTRSGSLQDSPRTSAHTTYYAYDVLHRNRPHIGRRAVAVWSACNLLVMVLA